VSRAPAAAFSFLLRTSFRSRQVFSFLLIGDRHSSPVADRGEPAGRAATG